MALSAENLEVVEIVGQFRGFADGCYVVHFQPIACVARLASKPVPPKNLPAKAAPASAADDPLTFPSIMHQSSMPPAYSEGF